MRPPLTVANAPSGSAQLPPIRHINERSASSAVRLSAWSSGRQGCERRQIVRARLERERALSGRGDHHVHPEGRGVGWGEAQARQPREREHRGVDDPVGHLAQPRVDVAAKIFHGHPGERPEELCAPADARRPDHGSGSKRRLPQHQDIGGVHPGRDGGDDEALVVLGREVLGRMDGDVDLVALEGVQDRVDEQAFQAGRRLAGRCPLVARRRHRNDLGLHAVLREATADLVRLSQGKRRAACADPERHSVSGSRRRSSISNFACRSSAPGSDRSFSSTIGSCRSFAATPRATASTASRSRGVRSESRPA